MGEIGRVKRKKGKKLKEDDMPALLGFATLANLILTNSKFSDEIQLETDKRKRAEQELHQGRDQLRETFFAAVNALASTVELKDPYTAAHQQWVTRLACTIATEMDLSKEQIEGIRMAGLIHDIGKMMVPAEFLSKPGTLTEIEYDAIKVHPQSGYDIVKEIQFPWPVAQIILQHHERMNGSGYPHNLQGDQILFEARLLAVSDVVESMSSHRPYRERHGIEFACEEISNNRGTLYDSDIVDVCLKVIQDKKFTF